MHHYPGTWIVLEGMDGSGTTTAATGLTKRVFDVDKQHLVLLTREPTKRTHGREIRKLLADKDLDVAACGEKMTDLFVLDRYDHTDKVVIPALKEGLVVIQDRGEYSTVAYQGGVQGISYQFIFDKHKDMLAVPDAVIVFDVTLENALARMGKSTAHKEAFDQGSIPAKSNRAYKELPAIFERYAPGKHPIHVIDANKSVEEVLDQCWRIINPLLPYKRK
jgi:dTMP kinase